MKSVFSSATSFSSSFSNRTFSLTIALMVSLSSLFLMSFTKGANGVRFNTVSFKEAAHQAEYRNKPLMVYIGSKTCVESSKQEEIFKMKEVSILLNNNFFCDKFDTESFSGLMKASISWNVTSYPTILFFSPDGKLLMKESGYKNKNQVLELISKAQNMNSEFQAKKSGKTDNKNTEAVASK